MISQFMPEKKTWYHSLWNMRPITVHNSKTIWLWLKMKENNLKLVPPCFMLWGLLNIDSWFCLGSAWMMLSRPFIEYCIWGWDNLPRIVLMYYANFLSSPEGYFHTVICNADEFRNTTVNHDLHFISWDNPPKQHPHFLTVDDYQKMVDSNAPFARKFGRNEPVLDKIDTELLGQNAVGYVPGRWFSQANSSITNKYSGIRNITDLRPGPGAERLGRLINGLLSAENFHANQCSWHEFGMPIMLIAALPSSNNWGEKFISSVDAQGCCYEIKHDIWVNTRENRPLTWCSKWNLYQDHEYQNLSAGSHELLNYTGWQVIDATVVLCMRFIAYMTYNYTSHGQHAYWDGAEISQCKIFSKFFLQCHVSCSISCVFFHSFFFFFNSLWSYCPHKFTTKVATLYIWFSFLFP